MTTVGVLAPMPSEMKPVAAAMTLTRDGEWWRGANVVATRTGIGTKRAADATRRLLDASPVDRVLVVGIAGGMGASAVGDVIVPEVVVDKESGEEFTSTPFGGVDARGRLVTHDDFDMQSAERDALVAAGFVAVDMETAAVAAVCRERNVPWCAVRAISDLVGVTPGDVIGLANADGSPNVGASIRYLVTKPWRIPRLVQLARDSTRAANAAATTAASMLRS
jgi:adenosylhomocysteine nucleosidase